MPFSKYKNIADVLREFPLSYQEKNFVQQLAMELDPYFTRRLNFILQEGVVFNSEASICENIIYPILSEVWNCF